MQPLFQPPALRPGRAPQRRGGFTLIEVLVAMVIMAILAVMAWQGVDGIVRARDASNARLEQSLRLNTVLAQWEQDLAAVQSAGGVVPALAFDGATLRLTRRAPGGLQLVLWSLGDDGAAGVSRWLRWAAPPTTFGNTLQEQWVSSMQLADNAPGQLTMLSGLSQWQVYCFRGNDNAWSNCQSSNDSVTVPVANGSSAPTQVRQALPTGVRLVLTFAGGASAAGSTGTLTRDVALGPQAP